ncbi:MAG: hypothetical protein J6S67_01125 [Methanobrevibacter sp.]|nr:hypothetical protein [Methanobrevibacter sp.]
MDKKWQDVHIFQEEINYRKCIRMIHINSMSFNDGIIEIEYTDPNHSRCLDRIVMCRGLQILIE